MHTRSTSHFHNPGLLVSLSTSVQFRRPPQECFPTAAHAWIAGAEHQDATKSPVRVWKTSTWRPQPSWNPGEVTLDFQRFFRSPRRAIRQPKTQRGQRRLPLSPSLSQVAPSGARPQHVEAYSPASFVRRPTRPVYRNRDCRGDPRGSPLPQALGRPPEWAKPLLRAPKNVDVLWCSQTSPVNLPILRPKRPSRFPVSATPRKHQNLGVEQFAC